MTTPEVLNVDSDELHAAADALRAHAAELDELVKVIKETVPTAVAPASVDTADGTAAPIRVPAVDAMTRIQQRYVKVVSKLASILRHDADVLGGTATKHDDTEQQQSADITEIVTV